MRTLLAVAKLELLLLLRDQRLIAAGVVLWSLLAALLWVGQSRFSVEQGRLREAQRLAREQWVHRGEGNAHAAAHVGTYVYRPATPLSLLHPGAEPYMGVAAHIEAHQQANLFYRPMLDRASIVRWADVSAATLLQTVIPLLLLLLACGVIAGDREEGRLLLNLSQGASPTAFALGKIAGVLAVATLLLLPVMVIALAMVAQASIISEVPSDQVGRLAVLALGYGATYLFFLAAGITISAFSKTRQSALLASVGLWAVLCLIVPRTLIAVAEKRSATPDRDVVRAAILEDRMGVDKVLAMQERVKNDALRKYKVSRVEDLPINMEGLLLQAGEERVNGIEDKHNGQVWEQFKAQEAWSRTWGYWLSPTVSLKSLGESLSGTDATTLRAFLRHVELYRRDWVKRLNEAVTNGPRGRSGRRSRDSSTSDEELWESIPPFQYQPPSLDALSGTALRQLLALWTWALLSVGAAIYGVQRRSGASDVLS